MSAHERRIRAGGGAGLLFVVLLVVGVFLPGAPPHAHDSVPTLTRLTADARGPLLVGQFVLGLAAATGLLFLAAMREFLGGDDEGPLATAATAGGLFALVFTLIGTLCFTALAFKAVRLGDGAPVRFVVDLGNDSVETAKFGFATMLAAGSAALAARSAARPALAWLGYGGAAYVVFTAVALFSESRALEAGSPIDLASSLPIAVWLVAVAVAMLRVSARPRPT
jgi:hypothetical protein